MLPGALESRWRDTAARAAWVRHVVAQARRHLPHGAWEIRHAPGWPDDERQALARALDPPPIFVEDATHRAGLAIGLQRNVIDGTLEGLLVDRAEVGAQLLVELRRIASPEAQIEAIR